MKKYILLLQLSLITKILIAQTITLSGFVKDINSGEPLINATVFDKNENKGTLTNEYGYFMFTVSKKKQNLSISYVGYKTQNLTLSAQKDTTLSILLAYNSLDEIVVTEKTAVSVPKERIGIHHLSIQQIKNIPTLLGESDVLKALTMMPGVSSGQEGTAGVIVRGGSPDQNLTLLDGATVYNNAHLLGFLSVFNPGAVKNVTLIKGGFPAEYGGRLSSIIDVGMKEGNLQKKQTELTLGTISSWIVTEGPIKKDTISYMLSARNSWLGLFALPQWFNYKNSSSAQYTNYWMYDLNGKINFKLSPTDNLYISGFHGYDIFQNRDKDQNELTKIDIGWGNTQANLRYSKIVKPNLFANLTYHFNQYKYDIILDYEENDTSLVTQINTSSILDHTINGKLTWIPLANLHLKLGGELKKYSFSPSHITQVIENVETKGTNQVLPFISHAMFVENNIDFRQKLNINLGLRWSGFYQEQTTFQRLEPRLSLNYIQPHQAWQFNLTRMYQPIHLLSVSNSGLPTDIWLPSTANITPQRADQIGIGYARNILDNTIELTTEVYFKRMSNLIDFKTNSSSFFATNQDLESLVVTDGIGRAYGWEFFLQKKEGRFNGWLGYTLSWNNRRFSTINNNEWYPFRYDRRHDLEMVANYKLTPTWSLSSNFVYATGIAVSLPDALQNNYFNPQHRPDYIITSRNNQRFPAYHRLDLSAKKEYETKNGRKATLSFGIYNAYGRRNPYYLNFFVSQNPDSTVGGFKSSIYGEAVFTFLPFINYNIKF